MVLFILLNNVNSRARTYLEMNPCKAGFTDGDTKAQGEWVSPTPHMNDRDPVCKAGVLF